MTGSAPATGAAPSPSSLPATLRASLTLAAGAASSGLVALAGAKAWALLLGPGGAGDLGLAQGLVGLVLVICDFGLGSALVREGAALVRSGQRGQIRSLIASANLLVLGAAAAALTMGLVAPGPISAAFLGRSSLATVLTLLCAGLVTVRANVQLALANAFQRAGDLARIGFAGQLAATVTLVGVIALAGSESIPLALLGSAGARWAAIRWGVRSSLRGAVDWPSWTGLEARADPSRLRSLTQVGAKAMLGAVLSSGVDALLPAVVLHRLSRFDVGCFRAAAGFGATYVGLALAVVAQSYLPRVSADSGDPARVGKLAQEQHELLATFALPLLLAVHLAAPVLVPVLYTSQFTPAVPLVEWQAVADFFRFTSWAFTLAVFARSTTAYLLLQAGSAACLLVSTWVGLGLAGIAGAGMAALATYLLQGCVAAGLLWKDTQTAYSRRNVALVLAGFLALALAQGTALSGIGWLRLAVSGPLCFVAWGYAAMRLRALLRTAPHVQ